jgi:integrase
VFPRAICVYTSMYAKGHTKMASLDLKHLWNRGRNKNQPNWYLKLPIPRAIRKQWPTKTKSGKDQPLVILPLDTGDLAVARRKRDRLVVAYGDVFARLEAGEHMSPDEIKAAVSLDLGAITERIRANMLDSFHRATPRDVVVQYGAYGSLKPTPDADLFVTIAELAKREGVKIEPGTALWDSIATTITRARNAAYAEAILLASGTPAPPMMTASAPAPVSTETLSEALAAWLANPRVGGGKPQRPLTTKDHRTRAQRFIDWVGGGDIPLASVKRSMASDFLDTLNGSMTTRTKNNHRMTLWLMFKNAAARGRFSRIDSDNPFAGLHQTLTKDERKKHYSPFRVPEIQAVLDSFKFETSPKRHTPATALPWASLVSLFTGARIEEIAQLVVGDIKECTANGATMTTIRIHDEGSNNLKTEPRLLPIHSLLVRAGFLDYVAALPKNGPLFPGLTRRASKDNRIGARISELFGKRLKALGIKQKAAEEKPSRRLCFHSFRHNVGQVLDNAKESKNDIARVLGHAVEGISLETYSHEGPGLKRVAAVVEAIQYEGLRLPRPSGQRAPFSTPENTRQEPR